MKNRLYLQTMALLCIVAAMTNLAKADWSPTIANDFVKDFNNKGGFVFVYPDNVSGMSHYPYAPKLTAKNGNVDISIYSTSGGISDGQSYFRSFCIEPNNQNGLRYPSGAGKTLVGTLNYKNNRTTSVVGGNNLPLTVGAALLYKLYATGEFASLMDENVRSNLVDGKTVSYGNRQELKIEKEIQYAIRNLMGIETSTYGLTNYLRDILFAEMGVSSVNALKAIYNPGENYAFMDDYSVFVMNVTSDGVDSQDFLVMFQHPTTDVPEPATLLLWTLGSLGTFGAARRARKQRAE